MRLIAFFLALVSFVTGLCAIVAGAMLANPWIGAACTIVGFCLTALFLVVAELR